MLTIAMRFPGGRYHATPTGHHVNEGLVEWPPSPWRLLRALLAVGYNTLGWEQVPPEAARLLNTLSETVPSYWLPPATLAQSRHYMPLGVLDKGREKTTLVFDTWARIPSGALVVQWPVTLGADAQELLEKLLQNLNYLGRSESWVEARCLTPEQVPTETPDVWPDVGERPRGPHGDPRRLEQVRLLCAEAPEVYQSWRDAAVTQALAPFPLPPDGKKPTAKLGKERQRALAPYPATLLDCLQTDTRWLEEQGWSQPPGSRWLSFWRKRDALSVHPSRPELHGLSEARQALLVEPNTRVPDRLQQGADTVACMLLSLSLPSGNRHALPPVTRTVAQANLLHRSLVSKMTGAGAFLRLVPTLTGFSGENQMLAGHRHAYLLPISLAGDNHLDHILVWARDGLDGDAQAALRSVRSTYAKNSDALRVAVAGLGGLELLLLVEDGGAGVMAGLLGGREGACRWRSLTPYVPPRHLKSRGANSLEGQVKAELAQLGYGPVQVRKLSLSEVHQDPLGQETDFLQFRHFERLRKDRQGRAKQLPPQDYLCALELVFETPVKGPISIGFNSHFGLGLFTAVESLAIG